MKKQNFVLIALLFITTMTFSQRLTVGVRGGLNVSTVFGDPWTGVTDQSKKPRISFNLGVSVLHRLNDKTGIQAELFYSGEGFTFSGNGDSYFKYSYTLNYLSLPVFFKYNFTNHFYIMGGPQFSYLLSAKEKDERYGGTVDIADDINKLGVGIVPVVGYDLNKFSFDIRYYAGLTRINKESYSAETLRSGVFSVVVSYKVFNVIE